MPNLSDRLDDILKDDAHLSEDRAVAELRVGRPLVLEARSGCYLGAAVDGMSSALFEIFHDTKGAALILTAQRAETMGVVTEHGISIPLAGLDYLTALQLASSPDIGVRQDWSQIDPVLTGGFALCKKALLLPALLVAPLDATSALPHGLLRYDLTQSDDEPSLLDLDIVSEANVPLPGNLSGRFLVFRGGPASRDQVAIIIGSPDLSKPVQVRVHSACLTGDLFGSLRCDCGDQLKAAVRQLASGGGGVLIYLDQEGRGIGIANKMRAYALQDYGFDTIDADAVLGFNGDERDYEYAAAMLVRLGYRKIFLLTNNPEKISALTKAGIDVVGRRPVFGRITAQNEAYLNTKASKANHFLVDFLDSDA